jgi:hypothetical protein
VGKRVVGALFVVPLMRMVELPSRVLYLASLIKKQLASLIKKQLASLIKKQLEFRVLCFLNPGNPLIP